MTDERVLRGLLRLAIAELRRHNENYHVHTPEIVLDLLEQALKTSNAKTLVAILRDCEEAMEERRNRPFSGEGVPE